MIVINLFGGPGSGKSTTAAGVFAKLKMMGHNVELVREYAKELTWEQRMHTLGNQVHVFGEQLQRFHILEGKVDAAITDSPLLLSEIYMPKDYPDSFRSLVREMAARQVSYNVLLRRSKPFNPKGRNHNLEESIVLDEKIADLLDSVGAPYSVVPGDEFAPDYISQRAHELIGLSK